MGSVIRVALVATALFISAALPVAAQQAGTAPTASAPANQASENTSKDVNTLLERLRNDFQRMADAARQGTQDVLNRQTLVIITTDQLIAIAAGAVAGAVVVDLLGGGGIATLTAAAICGVAGHWIYTQPAQSAPVPGG